MVEINSQEALMVWIMNHLAQSFKNKAILKGGMMLRLLECPRYTNDLDYVFVPFKSKKDIWPLIKEALSQLDGLKLEHTMNSISLRIIVHYKDVKLQIEANTAEAVASEDISTGILAKMHQQLSQIIRIMKLDVAMAHKMAAWNERGLMRDIYDIYYFYSRLNIKPDMSTLLKRLAKTLMKRKGARSEKYQAMTLQQFLDKLKETTHQLDEKMLRDELTAILPVEELAGLHHKIRRAILELIDQISHPK